MAHRYHHQGCNCSHCLSSSSLSFESGCERYHRTSDQDDGHKRNNKRGILKPFSERKYGDQQVDDLHETLDDANFTMSENERLLSDYRSANIRRSMELDELRSELEKSKDRLSSRCSSPQQVVHFHTTPIAQDGSSASEHQRLLYELNQEKRSRQRAETENSHLVELLDASLKGHSNSAHSADEKVNSDVPECLKAFQNVVMSVRRDADIDCRLKEIEGKLIENSANERVHVHQRLEEELQMIKDDLKKREATEKTTELMKELRLLESELLSKHKLLDTSRQQSDKLASKVDELGFQLGQIQREKNKALSCLEVTTHHLDKTIGGQRELEKQIQDLKEQLSLSEKKRAAWEEKCVVLVKECRLQSAKQEHDRIKITEMESTIADYKNEKSALEEKYEKLGQQLSVKTAEESRLNQQCKELQSRLTESINEREKAENRLAKVEQEYNKLKMEVCELQAELRTAISSNSSLHGQIQMLEHNLLNCERTCEQLEKEVNEVSSQLQFREKEKETQLDEIEAWRSQALSFSSEKKELELELSDIKRQLVSSKEATMSNHSHALHTAKKHKQRLNKLEEDNITLEQEKAQLALQLENVLRNHQECTTKLKNQESLLSLIHQENEEMKETINELETLKGHQEKEVAQFRNKLSELRCNLVARRAEVEKCEVKLKDSQNEREILLRENTKLKEELSQTKEECTQTKERITMEVYQSEEMNRSEVLNLRSELQSYKEENSQVKEKISKISHACQTLKVELVQVNLNYEHKQKEVLQLEECLEETYLKTSRREHDLTSEFNSLKAVHSQELESLQKSHKHAASKLQQRISKLQIQLADEQSTVRAMRRHQLQIFGDHQKIIQDDLTKSFDDTEKIRREYIEAKRCYEEKEATLEVEASEYCKEEIESLRQQLAKYQSMLHQQSEDHEVILRAAAGEVDGLVRTIGKRVYVPIFPTVVEQDSSIKNWTAEIMAKFQWLQKEVNDVVALEIKLRRKLKEQLKNQRLIQIETKSNKLCTQLTDDEQ